MFVPPESWGNGEFPPYGPDPWRTLINEIQGQVWLIKLAVCFFCASLLVFGLIPILHIMALIEMIIEGAL